MTDEPTPQPTVLPDMPDKSSTLSYDFALTLLDFASGGGEAATVTRMRDAGITHILSMNYTKPSSDTSHTCAYVVGKCVRNGKNVYVVVVRGTSGGEWTSNFDFAPSHDNDTQYAENFLYCAQDIYEHIKAYLKSYPTSQVVVCGHSRGGAAANLLGVLLNNEFGKERVYAYTFATPTTVRGDAAKVEYDNIFNFINPDDAVPCLPLAEYGYVRAGKDIMLRGTGMNKSAIKSLSNIYSVAPTIKQYYEEKHALDGPGLSEDGMSVFDLVLELIGSISGSSYTLNMPEISQDSDMYPIKQMLDKFTNILTLVSVKTAHEPGTYKDLIKRL